MAYTINTGKELAQAPRPVAFCDFLFADGATLRVASIAATFGGNAYEARIAEQDIAQLAALAETGVDRIPSVSVSIADPDGTILSAWERGAGRGFKGARLTLTLALHYLSTGEFSTDSLIPFVGICDVPGVDEKCLTVTANSKLNLSLVQLPTIPLQTRCPWNNPVTEAQRTQASDPNSCFYRCGETRDLGTAPPCAYTKETCTQTSRFAGCTWAPPLEGSGREYISGSKIAWRNADTRSKGGQMWPLWLGGKCWLEAPAINVVGDANYTRGEIAIGYGQVDLDKVILNGIELNYGTSGDYRWHYVNHGTRDGTPNEDAPYNSTGDPYGSMTVIQVLAPRSVWSPDSLPQVRVLGRRAKLRVYRRIASCVGNGGDIVVTFDGPNEDCAGNPPFSVTIEGAGFANGTHELVSWAYGPPGTITLATHGTGSTTGGWCYYEASGSVNGADGVSTPWALMEALWWSRLEYGDLDVLSFADAAKVCNAMIDPTSSGTPFPRFSTSIALRDPVQASEFIRGIRQSISGMLVPTSDGLIRLALEGTLAEQQPAAVDGSNYDTPGASKLRDGTAANGYAAYKFDESNSWDWKRLSRAVAQMPNRVAFTFIDPVQGYAVSNFSLADSDDMARVDHEQPGGLQVKPEGIATQNHALRIAKLGLAKLHRGHAGGNDTRGTEPYEWCASFRGCKVRVGDIIIADNDRLGLANQMIRVTSIKPSRNFETITFQGHYHSDNWYLDSLGDSADPSQLGEDIPPFPWVNPASVPGNVQAIGGAAFLLTKAEDGKTATLSIAYDPPAVLNNFAGVSAHVEAPDGSLKVALSNDYDYNGDPTAGAGTEARRGTCQAKMAQPVSAGETWRVYLTSRGKNGYKVPLVFHGATGESPSMTIAIAQGTTGALTPPALPSSVVLSEVSRWLRESDQTTWVKVRVRVTLPSAPTAKEWVSIWLSFDNGATWEGASREHAIAATPVDIDIDVPALLADATWKAKVTTSDPNGANSPVDAVESAGLAVGKLADPAVNAVTDANAIAQYLQTFDGVWYWGPDLTWKNPTAAAEVNFWIAKIYIQWVDASGNPDPDYGVREIVEDNVPGKTVTVISDRNWPIPPEGSTYKTARLTCKATNRANVEVLQTTCWPGGADHLDITPVAPAGGLRVDRSDATKIFGLHTSGGKFQPKASGAGVGLDAAGNLMAVLTGVLGLSGGAVNVNLGSGVQNYLGAIYARVAQGLGFDVSGNIQIPSYGIGQSLLANQQIVDSARMVDYAIGQIKLQNAQIIDAARIKDLAVLNAKVGYSAIGSLNVGNGAILNAHIADCSIAKLTAGAATFTGDVTFQNTGNIQLFNGGNVQVSPGSVGAVSFVTGAISGNWTMIGGPGAPSGSDPYISNPSTASYVQAGGYRISGSPVKTGQTVTVIYKCADGTTNGYLYFNGGILTQYA
jgi:hypothetical protein